MTFLRKCKTLIDNDNLEELQAEYANFDFESDSDTSWQYIYVQLFNHACIKNKPAIASWLKSLYDTFDIVDKIALRQAFAYGEFMLRTKLRI